LFAHVACKFHGRHMISISVGQWAPHGCVRLMASVLWTKFPLPTLEDNLVCHPTAGGRRPPCAGLGPMGPWGPYPICPPNYFEFFVKPDTATYFYMFICLDCGRLGFAEVLWLQLAAPLPKMLLGPGLINQKAAFVRSYPLSSSRLAADKF